MTAKGISIHIGLNAVDPRHYDGWAGPLNACEADAADMQAIAASKKYKTNQLLTSNATRANVSEMLAQAAKELGAGDILFLSYSGHGGQVPDENDDEPDGLDETWCLYDGQMLDDEVNNAFAQFKAGVRIIALSDSCHSKSAIKSVYMAALRASGVLAALTPHGDTPAMRAMPRDVAMRVYRKHQEFYDGLQARVPKGIEKHVQASALLLSACQDNQTSADGMFNGLYTATLLRVWKKGGYKGNYRQFCTAIRELMPPTQSPGYFRTGAPNTTFEAQTPFEI